MSFISLNIPEREINLHFVNSAGLIFQSITEVIGGGRQTQTLPYRF
jgi:hypothetical protein